LASKKKPNPNQRQAVAPPLRAELAATPLGGGFGRDLANWLFPVYLLMIIAGFLAIWKYGSPAGNPNGVRALFLAMNSATLSGFTEGSGVGGLNHFGQWIAFLLVIGGSLFTMIVGGLAVIRIVRLPFSDADLIWSALAVEGTVLLVGTSVLWDMDRSPFQAMFLAGSSFGNCGQYVANLPKPSNFPVHAVILPLSILGGLGLPVLMELWCAITFRAKLSTHSKTVVSASAWLYVIGLVLILALNLNSGSTWLDVRGQLSVSSVFSVQSRTGGLAIGAVKDLTPPAQWILVVLMLIGASSAGTGSGLKTTTIAELARGTRKLLRGESAGRSFGIAVAWLSIYLGLLLGAVLLLSHISANDPAENILFDAVSAMSNVGFTSSPIADEKGVMFAYCAIILVGRMAPLMVLWWMAETTPDAELAIG
jgi:trk system potassium uptake protein TrkH